MSFHYLAFRAFVHATESEQKVTEAMEFVTGKENPSRQEVEGHHGNPIVILELEVKGARNIDQLFRRMETDDVARILDTLEDRVDEDFLMFFRLDKQQAYLGRMVLSDDDDFIQVRGKIEAYPKRHDIAMASVRSYLESFIEPQ
jgi:RNA binding exosome subunit